MGDRANVIVKSRGEQVCLYTHWKGTELPSTLQASLQRGIERIDDFQYLTRIIFCDMVEGNERHLSGFGITQNVHDGDRAAITINIDEQTITVGDNESVSISDFMSLENVGW